MIRRSVFQIRYLCAKGYTSKMLCVDCGNYLRGVSQIYGVLSGVLGKKNDLSTNADSD